MGKKEEELIKCCQFKEICLDEVEKKLDVNVLGNQNIPNNVISIFYESLDDMNDKELFDYLVDWYLLTGKVIIQKDVYIPGINKKGIMLVNSNERVLYITQNNSNLDDLFYRKCEISRFQGITDKIDDALSKNIPVDINILPSNGSSIYSVDYFDKKSMQQETKMVIHLGENKTDCRILNYIIDNFAGSNDYSVSSINLFDRKGMPVLDFNINGNLLRIEGSLINSIDLHLLNDISKSVGNNGYQRQLRMEDIINE